jgi:hypothetical protein
MAGRYADTDSILVRVNTANVVTGLFFVYRAGKDFAAAVADYTSSLGKPRSFSADSAGGRIEHATWEDGRTHFELNHFVGSGGSSRVSAAMFDQPSR